MLYPVILSGGTGTRLWPMSRQSLPKQLLPVISERTMLQETVLRLQGLRDLAAPAVISNNEHRFLIAEQLREINCKPQVLMLEPAGRDTAPAVAATALYLQASDPDAQLLVLPSDHAITDVPAFHAAIDRARQLAAQGYLVTFGIVPERPETGYGYIQRGDPLDEGGCAYAVQQFVEKPDEETAQAYIETGEYFWNSGMFLFSAQSFLAELEQHSPAIVAACRAALEHAYSDLDFYRLGEAEFKAASAQSIDRAVMEKTTNAAVVPASMGWSDIGSWLALWEFQSKDSDGNFCQGPVYTEDTRNSYIRAERRLVATLGLENVVVVETPDAILVADRQRSQDVRKVVERLKIEGRPEHEEHRRVYRPWGSYECMDGGHRFQVKRIVVNPGAQNSLQRHFHRAEHWIIVSGTAEITIGNEVKLLGENESIYIPLGIAHRMRNPGRIPLVLVEVQSGPYLGEDDIVRDDDSYGRHLSPE